MRIFRTIPVLLLSCVLSTVALAGNKKGGIYLFGISSSFTDTVAYVTTVQRIDSVDIKRGAALPLGQRYSNQLEDYIESVIGKPNQTAATFYSNSKKRVEKDRNKVMNRFRKRYKHQIETLADQDFTYTYVSE